MAARPCSGAWGVRTCVSSFATVLRHVCRLEQSRPPGCSGE